MNIHPPFPERPRVALVGAGRVGTAVTVLLQRAGCEVVGVWSRSAPSAERAHSMLEAPLLDLTVPTDADLVIIGASDAAITATAGMIAPVVSGSVTVAHLSGSLGPDVLEPVIDKGATPVAMHPVQACHDVATAIERLPGSAWGITVAESHATWVEHIVRDLLQGTPVHVDGDDRPMWHAACMMTSNGIAALMAFGESVLREIGMSEPEKILGPLAAGTVANALDGGGGGTTLTGPVVRGEAETLRRHIEALNRDAPHLVDGYKMVVRTILSAARSHGRIDEAAASKIERLLA